MKKFHFLLLMSCAMLILSGNATAQNLPAYLPSNGLVAWYPFNGNANDESGNGNDGVVNGATLTSDRVGIGNNAYNFNGLDNYIECLSSGPTGTGITISYWYLSEQTNVMCAIGYGGNAFGTCFDVAHNYHSAQTVGPCYGPAIHSHGTLISRGTANFNPGNNWNHVIAIIPSGAIDLNDALIFHNGFQLLDTCSFANYGVANINIGNDWPVKIGCGSGRLGQNTLNFFNGKLDDIAIYNRALTQEEITALYTGTPVNNNGGNTTANAVPPGIPYQAVVRNANGQVAANAAATTKFTLHQNTTDGAVEYQETHALTTNAQGLVSAVIGQGTAVQGTFGGINWSNTTKFLQVEVDLGNGFVDLGTQQLMSVPFALYAANGPAGPQGPAGADGADGATGPQGPAGNDGQDASLSVSLTGDTLYTGTGFIIVPGISAANYPSTTIGCMDNTACNYMPTATQSDNSCLFLSATCDDGNVNTTNDVVNNSCQCVGTSINNDFFVGQNYQGGKIGYIFEPGDLLYVPGETHGIIVSSTHLSEATPALSSAGGLFIGQGSSNTQNLINLLGQGNYAARLCWDYVSFDGYDDWFLPSKFELIKLIQNNSILNVFYNAAYWSSSGDGGYVWFVWNSYTDIANGSANQYFVIAARYF